MEDQLGAAGYEVTAFHPPPVGTRYRTSIRDALRLSDYVLVLQSEAAATAGGVGGELAQAVREEKPIVLINVEASTLDARSSSPSSISTNLRAEIPASLQRVVEAATRRVADATSAQPSHDARSQSTFVNRTAELDELRRLLLEDADIAPVPPVVVVTGFGGVGKTALVNQFVQRYRPQFSEIVFRSAARIGDDAETATPVWREASGDNQLLVIDDVERLDQIAEFLARQPPVRSIIISRSLNWPESFSQINLEVLDSAAGLSLVESLAPGMRREDAYRLVELTGGHPLALSRAARLANDQSIESALATLEGLQESVRAASNGGEGFYYLDSDDPEVISEFERAFLNAVGDPDAIELFRPERGSWRRRWSERYSSERVEQLLDKAERAVEVASLVKPEADANRSNAEAIARLLEASAAIPNLVIASGSVLFIKLTDNSGEARVFSKTLTATELRRFQEHQHKLSDPATALQFLGLIGSHEDAVALPAPQEQEL